MTAYTLMAAIASDLSDRREALTHPRQRCGSLTPGFPRHHLQNIRNGFGLNANIHINLRFQLRFEPGRHQIGDDLQVRRGVGLPDFGDHFGTVLLEILLQGIEEPF